MPYLQLRVTIDPSGNRSEMSVNYLVLALIRKIKSWHNTDWACLHYTTGYEQFNKYGEPCDPHYHFNCIWEHDNFVKDPLRQVKEFLKKTAIAKGFKLCGNKVWSCTIVEEPKDLERWLRYPLKEHPILPMCRLDPAESHLPDKYDSIEKLTVLAQDERKRSVEANVIAREKSRDRVTLKDKLFIYLDENLDENQKQHQDIWIEVLNFYELQGKAICFQTVSGYTILYQLKCGYITKEQAYQMRQNPP